MKYAVRGILVLTYVLWFSFITTTIDTLHSHRGPFDDNPVLDWQESELCQIYWSKHGGSSAIEASRTGLTWSLNYCPASTYLAASTGNTLEVPADISSAMVFLGISDREESTAPRSLLEQLPKSRGPPVA